MRMVLLILIVLTLPLGAAAQDRLTRLYAPEALIETGLLRHILPRFSLKTQVKVEIVTDGTAADILLGADGRALFQDSNRTWHLKQLSKGHKPSERLAKWLRSDVGIRTITGYAPNGKALFQPPAESAEDPQEVALDGDVNLGLQTAKAKCGRCHAVDPSTRMTSIGSTPSFFILRTLGDWQERFANFYDLNPHPAFTQVADLTDPFPEDRPSPIVPVEMTLDEVAAILAYVSGLDGADLGKPLEHN
ncbi:hypothetical protein J7443_00735 [Tropicibacter sp. R15_0]|nr:hypothetical protein [Tropicibacter sp. R15_0]